MMKKLLAVGLGLGFCLTSLYAAEEKTPRTISVTGTSEISVAPDICYMSFSVETSDKSAIKAYNENNDIMNKVNSAIKALGIEAKDLNTSYFSIAPQYYWEEKTGKNVFDGYKVYNSLNVKVRDLSKVGKILDAAVNAGATTVGGVSFTVENPKKYNVELREQAIKAAFTKATQMANLTGLKLGKPMSVSENEPGDYYQYYAQANVMTSMYRDGGESAPSIEAGEFKVTHTVYITYEVE
ncbi:SIMPL domain-containing protein [bacterium]|nr:SIMPL domain-containing protein [bacterium]